MAQSWYVAREGKRAGPITGEQLKKLATTGQLKPTDLVWAHGMPSWVPASQLKGLFPEPATQPPPIPLPLPKRSARPVPATTEDDDVHLAEIAQDEEADEPATKGSNKTLWIGLSIAAPILVLFLGAFIYIATVVSAVSSPSTARSPALSDDDYPRSREPNPASMIGVLVFFAALFVFGFLFQMLPGFVAWIRGHPNTVAICLLCFFLGWTVVGWVAALVWAATNQTPARTVLIHHSDR